MKNQKPLEDKVSKFEKFSKDSLEKQFSSMTNQQLHQYTEDRSECCPRFNQYLVEIMPGPRQIEFMEYVEKQEKEKRLEKTRELLKASPYTKRRFTFKPKNIQKFYKQ